MKSDGINSDERRDANVNGGRRENVRVRALWYSRCLTRLVIFCATMLPPLLPVVRPTPYILPQPLYCPLSNAACLSRITPTAEYVVILWVCIDTQSAN